MICEEAIMPDANVELQDFKSLSHNHYEYSSPGISQACNTICREITFVS